MCCMRFCNSCRRGVPERYLKGPTYACVSWPSICTFQTSFCKHSLETRVFESTLAWFAYSRRIASSSDESISQTGSSDDRCRFRPDLLLWLSFVASSSLGRGSFTGRESNSLHPTATSQAWRCEWNVPSIELRRTRRHASLHGMFWKGNSETGKSKGNAHQIVITFWRSDWGKRNPPETLNEEK